MRNLILAIALISGPALADGAGKSGHENTSSDAVPVQQTADGAVYGARLPESTPAPVTIDALIANPSDHLGKPAAYSGRITQVCQKMGCWLVLTGEDGSFARVAMRDHAYSVPKNASGPAIVYGTVSEKVHSAEEIAHLEKDGANAPAPRELSIDAASVMIGKAG
ncbi:MAG: DUF4920 domain-containing protein [Dokdonella sp.]